MCAQPLTVRLAAQKNNTGLRACCAKPLSNFVSIALYYDYESGWITCEDKLCHVTRRHRVLPYPKGAPRASSEEASVCAYGAQRGPNA